jgi:hypothetical protein
LDAKLRSYEAVDEATGMSARRTRRLDAFAEKIFDSQTKRSGGVRASSMADNSRREVMERSFAGLAQGADLSVDLSADPSFAPGPSSGENRPPAAAAPVRRRTQQERRDAVAARRKMLGAFHTGKVTKPCP